ncbi:MAG: hypothetical protein EAZ97_03580 [Bacteroidetes bacterium]|nr:MAG: hypothetical protein EAZ97_03580 [Bacteroidota bacterium]
MIVVILGILGLILLLLGGVYLFSKPNNK